jgi:hypothetical protein
MTLGPRGLAYEVFEPLNGREMLNSSSFPLLAFCSSTEVYYTTCAAPGLTPLQHSFHAVLFPFDVFPILGSNSSRRLPTFGYCSLAAFRTLSGLYSTQYLPALFHAGTALGVLPFKAYFRLQVGTSSRTPIPSCGCTTTARCFQCISADLPGSNLGSYTPFN